MFFFKKIINNWNYSDNYNGEKSLSGRNDKGLALYNLKEHRGIRYSALE